MAIISFIKRGPKAIEKGVDKIFKREIKGSPGSPFENVDNLGKFPDYRNPKDLPGTELKKLKEIGKKIRENKKIVKDRNKESKKLFDQAGRIRGGLKMGGRAMYRSGSRVCKLAMKGRGRAYGKNS